MGTALVARRTTILAVNIILLLFAIICFNLSCAREDANAICVRQMHALWDAAYTYCMAQGIPFDTILEPKMVSCAYLKLGEPMCPLGNEPYPPFNVLEGPRCPNSDEHTSVFRKQQCCNAREQVWVGAIHQYSVRALSEKTLSWNTLIENPGSIELLSKGAGYCPLATNGYSPFILYEGPKCKIANHNEKVIPWRYKDLFDKHGNIMTNISLSNAVKYELILPGGGCKKPVYYK